MTRRENALRYLDIFAPLGDPSSASFYPLPTPYRGGIPYERGYGFIYAKILAPPPSLLVVQI